MDEEQVAQTEQTEQPAVNQDPDTNDGGELDLSALNDLEVITDDEAKIRELTEQTQEQVQPEAIDTTQQQAEQGEQIEAQEEFAEEQAPEREYQLQEQVPPVQPIPVESIKANLDQMMGEDIKQLDNILDTGEGSLSEAVSNILAKYTQAIGYEIASSLQPVIAPMQQQLELQQVQGLWQQFAAQHPDAANDPQIFNTMRGILEKGEATTYEAAYGLAKFRTGKVSQSNVAKPNQNQPDRAKQMAASLISNTATRQPSSAPSNTSEDVEGAFKTAMLQLGVT